MCVCLSPCIYILSTQRNHSGIKVKTSLLSGAIFGLKTSKDCLKVEIWFQGRDLELGVDRGVSGDV